MICAILGVERDCYSPPSPPSPYFPHFSFPPATVYPLPYFRVFIHITRRLGFTDLPTYRLTSHSFLFLMSLIEIYHHHFGVLFTFTTCVTFINNFQIQCLFTLPLPSSSFSLSSNVPLLLFKSSFLTNSPRSIHFGPSHCINQPRCLDQEKLHEFR